MDLDLGLGDPSWPRFFHRGTGFVEPIYGLGIWHRDRARGRLRKRVKDAGGNPDEIEYRAGIGPRLGGVIGQ